MRNIWISILTFLVFTTPSWGQVDGSKMMKGAKLEESKSPDMSIVLGVNETAGGIVEQGWPIIVSAAVVSTQEQSPELPSNLTLQAEDQTGARAQIAFESIPQGDDKAQRFWMASESATQSLSLGTYSIGVAPVDGWGVEAAEFVVESADPEHAGLLDLLKIQQSLLMGKDDEASAKADALTTSDPENVDAWVAKGDILMGNDLPDDAIQAYQKALDIAEKDGDEEPLFILERHRAALFRSLEKRGVIKPEGN